MHFFSESVNSRVTDFYMFCYWPFIKHLFLKTPRSNICVCDGYCTSLHIQTHVRSWSRTTKWFRDELGGHYIMPGSAKFISQVQTQVWLCVCLATNLIYGLLFHLHKFLVIVFVICCWTCKDCFTEQWYHVFKFHVRIIALNTTLPLPRFLF